MSYWPIDFLHYHHTGAFALIQQRLLALPSTQNHSNDEDESQLEQLLGHFLPGLF